MISFIIYAIISGLLVIIAISVIGLIVLPILAIVYSIICGLKANNGEIWPYFLSVKLIK